MGRYWDGNGTGIFPVPMDYVKLFSNSVPKTGSDVFVNNETTRNDAIEQREIVAAIFCDFVQDRVGLIIGDASQVQKGPADTCLQGLH